jgi:hypothetical protein
MFWVQLTELGQNIFFVLLQLTDHKPHFERLQERYAKMAANATTTRRSHISVFFSTDVELFRMAVADGVTSRVVAAKRGVVGWKERGTWYGKVESVT